MGLSAKSLQTFDVYHRIIAAFVFELQDLNAGKARIERPRVARGAGDLTTPAAAAVLGDDPDGRCIAHIVLLTRDPYCFSPTKKSPKLTSSAWGFTFSPSSYQGFGRSSD
jgi:hypothetical protein